jgi:hypothetical protein
MGDGEIEFCPLHQFAKDNRIQSPTDGQQETVSCGEKPLFGNKVPESLK